MAKKTTAKTPDQDIGASGATSTESAKDDALESEEKSPETEAIQKKKAKKDKKNSGQSIMDKINIFLARIGRVPLKEKLFFVQYLAMMMKSGISLSAGLNTLAKQTDNKYFAKAISEISKSVQKGQSFTESLMPHKKIFGELFINMIEAGELSGKLEEVLAQLYIQLKKQHELTSKVKGAMTYPVVIITAMVGIGIFMMVKVVPKLTSMMESFEAELPLATRILIKVSDTIVENGLLVMAGSILFVIAVIAILRTYGGKYYFQAAILKMPIISPIVKKINLARFSRTISSLLKTDMMIIKTFNITSNVLGNLHYRKAVKEMADKIKKGSQINEVVVSYKSLFPPVVSQIISVGEETGELDSILAELADFYENEVDKIMDNLPSIIEPLLILILGCGVGAMAVAIIMPMYTLTSSI